MPNNYQQMSMVAGSSHDIFGSVYLPFSSADKLYLTAIGEFQQCVISILRSFSIEVNLSHYSTRDENVRLAIANSIIYRRSVVIHLKKPTLHFAHFLFCQRTACPEKPKE